MTRKSIVLIALALVAASVSLLTGNASPAEAQGSPGPIIGAYAQPINGESNIEAIQKLEQTLGTTLPMVRTYAQWDDAVGVGKPLHTWSRDGGRDLFASVKPLREDGTIVRWSEISNAQPGSRIYREMQDLANGVRDFETEIIFGFHHEPEAAPNQRYGTSEEFKAAFRKLHSVFQAEGATNVQWAWMMTEWSFDVGRIHPNDSRVADLWYPGDDVVDIIASDPYNWDNCRGNTTDPWTSFEEEMAPLLRFHAKHPSKQLALAEFGSDEGSPGRKAEWLNDAQALMKTAPYRDTFAALMYFHDDGRQEGWPQCNWWLDSSSATTQATIDWFRDPTFRSRLDPRNTPSPNRPFCDGKRATIVGTTGADTLTGTNGNDVIVGSGGDDVIRGLGGNDTVCGGNGNDQIFGGGGADRLFGDAGRDRILGGFGPDTAFGGPGPDRMNGQHGNDILDGGAGNDTIRGGPHQDKLRGGTHADTILGQGGWDTIWGNQGNDTLSGGVGADTITGGLGVDRCNGNEGRNTINC